MTTGESAVLYPLVFASWWLLNYAVSSLLGARYKLSAHQVQLIVRVISYTLIPVMIIVGTLMDVRRPLSSANLNSVESAAVVMMVCYFFYDVSAYARLEKSQTLSDMIHHFFLGYTFYLAHENHRLERGLLLAMLVMSESPPWSVSLIIRELPDSHTLYRLRQRYWYLQWNKRLYVLVKFVHLPVLCLFFLSQHLRNFPHLSVEDYFYVVGVAVINWFNVLWYNQRLTMIASVRDRVIAAERKQADSR